MDYRFLRSLENCLSELSPKFYLALKKGYLFLNAFTIASNFSKKRKVCEKNNILENSLVESRSRQ